MTREVLELLNHIRHTGIKTVAALDNLNANIVTLNATVAAAVAKLGVPAGVAEADVQAAADAVGAANATLAAAVNPPA